MDLCGENPVIERHDLQAVEADLQPESQFQHGYYHKRKVQQNKKWDQHRCCCCSNFMKSHGLCPIGEGDAINSDQNAECHIFPQSNSVLHGTRRCENEDEECRRIEASEYDSGNLNTDKNLRIDDSMCSSQPWIWFQDRGHLYYFNRFIIPIAILLHFTGFGTLILIYTFTLERALPKKLIMSASISLILMLVLWSCLRILEYCLGRKKMGQWHDTLDAPINNLKQRNKKVQGLVTRVPFHGNSDNRGCTVSPPNLRHPAISISREKMQRRGAGRFWLRKFSVSDSN